MAIKNSNSAIQVCELLPWDSDFFGFPIGRISKCHIDQNYLEELFAWCKARNLHCIYYLADSSAIEDIQLAEKHGFHFIDIRFTLKYKNRASPVPEERHSSHSIRRAYINDLDSLSMIAKKIKWITRFMQDKRFPRERVADLYPTWLKGCFSNLADAVFVAEDHKGPVGFISCKVMGRTGSIGLVGVDPDKSNAGWGQTLVQAAVEWFAEQRCDSIEVITQGCNISAICLYERCGFLTCNSQLWLHKWFEETS